MLRSPHAANTREHGDQEKGMWPKIGIFTLFLTIGSNFTTEWLPIIPFEMENESKIELNAEFFAPADNIGQKLLGNGKKTQNYVTSGLQKCRLRGVKQ